MKTIKYIFAVTLFSSLIFGCKDKDREFTIEGRLMYDCETPLADITGLSMKQDVSLGIKKAIHIPFETDANGYFEVKYLGGDGTNSDLKILKHGEILRDIPVFQDIDLGNVYFHRLINFSIRTDIDSNYTVNDTLILPNFDDPFNENNNRIFIPGPFENEVIDTIWNYSLLGSSSYINPSEFRVSYRINSDSEWKNAQVNINEFCTSKVHEVIITNDE